MATLLGLFALVVVGYILVMPLLAYQKASQAVREFEYIRKRMVEGRSDGVLAAPAEPPVNPAAVKPAPKQAEPSVESAPPTGPRASSPVPPQPKPQSEIKKGTKSTTAKSGLIQGWEQTLGSSWSVWAGAAALAVGAVMLIKYMVDAGVLSPVVRCALGAAFGAALIGAGEVMARRGWAKPIAALPLASIPEAIASAGIAAIYASVYVAFGFYDLLGAGAAFAVLAVVSLGALSLSLRHGVLLALVGLAGAYAVPALINTGAAWALGLFGYQSFVTLACQGVVRMRGWTHLQVVPVIAAALWLVIWFVLSPALGVGDGPVVAGFAALVLLSGASMRADGAGEMPEFDFKVVTLSWANVIDLSAGLLAAVAVFAVVRADAYAGPSVAAAAATLLAMIALARRDERLVVLPFLALTVVAGLIAMWGAQVYGLRVVADYEFTGPSGDWAPIVVAAAALVFFVLGVVAAGLDKAPLFAPSKRPGLWTALAALGPAAMIGAGHARGYVIGVEGPWMVFAAIAAIFNAALAGVMYRRGAVDDAPTSLAAFALGALGAACLATAMVQAEAWLAVALALSLPAVAWLGVRLNIKSLQWIVAGLACYLLLRLYGDPFMLSDQRSGVADLWWVLPGYALPAAMFALAARFARGHFHRDLAHVLEAGSAVYSVMMITAATRLTMGAEVFSSEMAYLEAAVHTAAWLGMAYAIYFGDQADVAPDQRKLLLATVVWRSLAILSAVSVLFGPLWAVGLMGKSFGVGDTPFFNTLFVALLIPGLLGMAFARTARGRGEGVLMLISGGLGLALLFAYLNMSIRHLFHGSSLMGGVDVAAEGYAYSMAWIAYAGAVMVYGMVREFALLRKVALGLMALSMCKVFLVDMSTLEGLYRALSFLGLGAALIGLGFAYQRMARNQVQEVG